MGKQSGYADAWSAAEVPVSALDASWLAGLVPYPAADANKYTHGKLTVVAGSDAYPGACCLAACAAQRAGAGYTEVVTTPDARLVVLARRPSLVVRTDDAWDVKTLARMRTGHPAAALVGPGFDAAEERSARLTFAVLREAACPVVVDGGALSAVSDDAGRSCLQQRAADGRATVLTPHGGEAARLAKGLELVFEGPAQEAAALAHWLGCVVALKGPDTYISDGAKTVRVSEGTPALAKAGTGDVLAGMVGALLAAGLSAFDAASLGVCAHARAGRMAARQQGVIGVVPEDVAEWAGRALEDIAHGEVR